MLTSPEGCRTVRLFTFHGTTFRNHDLMIALTELKGCGTG